MKFKYFLRGFGIGILFASVIFFMAAKGSEPSPMTDAEIKERAQELGMVEKSNPMKDLLTTEKVSEAEAPDSAPVQTALSEEKTVTEDNEEGKTEQDKTEGNTAEKKEEEKTEKEDGKQDENDAQDDGTIKFTIEGGDSSYPISVRLKELGLIDDVEAFDNYLIENGYAGRLRVGEFTLKKGMDYQTIADTITSSL